MYSNHTQTHLQKGIDHTILKKNTNTNVCIVRVTISLAMCRVSGLLELVVVYFGLSRDSSETITSDNIDTELASLLQGTHATENIHTSYS